MTQLDSYVTKYSFAQLVREEHTGILEVTLHTNNASLVWNEASHRELPELFGDIGADPANTVVILTGAGKDFCVAEDFTSFPPFETAAGFDKVYWEGKRLFTSLMDIEVPIIAAVNGPARIHAEIPVLADIVLASNTAVFQDAIHVPHGKPPADGVQVIWPLILGINRGRYFLLTAQELDAAAALQLGVVSEVLPPDALMDRAWELARQLTRMPQLALRYTRVVLNNYLKQRLSQEVGYGLILQGAAIAAGTTQPDMLFTAEG
jgi:enoyl-CoA hydratase/carnithine racemase